MASVLQLSEVEARPVSLLELPLRELGPLGNRRTLPRVTGRFSLRGADGAVYHGIDLSFGGLMCYGDEPLWPGNQLRFDLTLEGEPRSIAVVARVVELVSFKNSVAMRLRFDDLDQASRKRIATWMSRIAG